MNEIDVVYQFCLNEYQYYINSYYEYQNDVKMAVWYMAKANAFACVIRVIETMIG